MQRYLIRVMDIILSVIGILFLLPVLLFIACWIMIDSTGGVFYSQVRTGRFGKPFKLLKFRTMFTGADKSGLLTVGSNDSRVTRAGLYLRRYKLDEFPQLWNVFNGDMSMVGPRPEVPKYTQLYTQEEMEVLNVRPGITDLASIVFSNENEILASKPNPEEYYIKTIMPLKIQLNQAYVQNPTLLRYFDLIGKTLITILRG
jgi:lipopolysaccharide/colanic/teichoic acid biosynthesis glycosyltransferase